MSRVPVRYRIYFPLPLPRGAPQTASLRPSWAALALSIPVHVLEHARLSGQVPESCWSVETTADGSRFVRYSVMALATWAASQPTVDTALPTLTAFTVGTYLAGATR